MDSHGFLADLAIVLVVASATGIIFRRLGQPSVLGYLAAGLIVGPYIPIPVFVDPERTHALSELGVILVMFVVGLELRLKRLVAVFPTAGVTTLVEVAVMLGAGFAVGQLIGWSKSASMFLGASVAISSTMVVSKVFDEHPVRADVRRHVMSVLVLQDVVAIVLAAVLTAVAHGQEVSPAGLFGVVGRLAGALAGILVVGLLFVPRLVRWVFATRSKELLVVVCIAICFGFALVADELGYSVALGAFFAGMLVAESGRGHDVELVTQPLRDTFAAIFFVAIGMEVDPRLALEHIDTAFILFAVVVVMQLLSVSIAGALSGNGLRRSVTAGLSLGQVGEFGFILAAIGIESGMAPASLGPIIVTVAVLTAFTTPLLVRRADAIVAGIDHVMPGRLRSIMSLYEAWFEKLRSVDETQRPSTFRRTVLVLAFDGVLSTAIVGVAAGWMESLRVLPQQYFGLSDPLDRYAVVAAAAALALVPFIGFVRATRALGAEVASRVFDEVDDEERAESTLPRLLEVSVQLMVLLAAGVPAGVLLWPIAGVWLIAGLGVAVVVAASVLWQVAGRCAPQVRSSAERLVDLLARQTARDADPAEHASPRILGLESAQAVTLEEGAYGVGMTLAQLDLRARTGATVVAIRNVDGSHPVPTGQESLREGDVLALAGTQAAIDRARELLLRGPARLEAERTVPLHGALAEPDLV